MGIPNVTRPCAFVFLRSADRLAVSEMFDEAAGTFWRPPGGGVEFAEHSRDAALRELREEFDLELQTDDLALLGVIENSFEFRGAPHHEICFIYEAEVDGSVLDRLDGAPVRDAPAGDAEIARVFDVGELLELDPVYPDGVQALLEREASGQGSMNASIRSISPGE